MNNCKIDIEENGLSKTKSQNKKQTYTLPSWRVNEIILIAVQFLNDAEFWKDGFNYQKAIMQEGIVIKGYSAFKNENLMQLQKVSLSVWNEGLCLIAHDSGTDQVCRMIAYNDAKNEAEIMQIIFHEYAHIRLRHTEQSFHGEAEAILFSAIATLLMIAEQELHIGRLIAQEKGNKRFFDGIKFGLMEKYAKKEAV